MVKKIPKYLTSKMMKGYPDKKYLKLVKMLYSMNISDDQWEEIRDIAENKLSKGDSY